MIAWYTNSATWSKGESVHQGTQEANPLFELFRFGDLRYIPTDNDQVDRTRPLQFLQRIFNCLTCLVTKAFQITSLESVLVTEMKIGEVEQNHSFSKRYAVHF